MNVSFKKASAIYLGGMLICTVLNLLGHYLDIQLGTHAIFSILCKLPPIAVMIGIMIRMRNARILFSGKFLTPYLGFVLLPFFFSALVNTGHPTQTPAIGVLLLGLFGMLTTVVWEELFFHYVGQMLFEKDDRYTISALAVLVLGFGLSHLCYLLLDVALPEEILWQTLLTTCFGFFSITLYAKVQNIWVAVLAHLAMNVLTTFSSLFAEKPYFHDYAALLDTAYCVCLVLAGMILYHLNKEKKHLAPLHHGA